MDFQSIVVELLVHCKGEVFYFAPWNHRAGYISIRKEQLPAGVIQFVFS
jgi:hypothetical protein